MSAKVPLGERPELDEQSSAWLRDLRAGGAPYDDAVARLHDLLLRVSRHELNRRAAAQQVTGPDLDDLAQQCANDAAVAVLNKLDTFRGDSRFTTWAFKFAIFEVSNALGRRYWQSRPAALEQEQWEALPDRIGFGPDDHAQAVALVNALRRAVDEELTAHQRELFVSIVVDGVPLDAVVAARGTSRNAVYKTIFDARRKIRDFLVANGYVDAEGVGS